MRPSRRYHHLRWLLPCCLVSGCRSPIHVESLYFPSWVIRLTLGIIGPILTLLATHRSPWSHLLPNDGLIVAALTLILATLFWLILFRA